MTDGAEQPEDLPRFEPEESLPTLRNGDLAITSTRRRDGKGIRVQVVRRQQDGTWLRLGGAVATGGRALKLTALP